MNAYRNYRRAEPSTGWTRIDMLLALFDGAIERLMKAEECLRRQDADGARPLAIKAQLIVMGMASGVNAESADECGSNLLRLYEFVVHQLRTPDAKAIRSSIATLETLRDGFRSIRVEAAGLEQAGRIAKADRLCMLHVTA